MALNIGNLKNLFDHSKQYDQGLGRLRKGYAEIVVADDGTGDFSDIQDAINSVKTLGGRIYIKNGNYYLNSLKMYDNISLIGEGFLTVIKITSPGNTTKSIDLSDCDNCTLKDLKIILDGTAYGTGTYFFIDLTTTTDIIFEKIRVDLQTAMSGDNGLIVGSCDRMRMINCDFLKSGSGATDGLFITTDIDNCFFEKIKCTYTDFIGFSESNTLTENWIINCDFGGIYILNDRVFANILIGNKISNQFYIGDDQASNRNILIGNDIGQITLSTETTDNIVIGNRTDVAITDNGTGNVVANNTVY